MMRSNIKQQQRHKQHAYTKQRPSGNDRKHNTYTLLYCYLLCYMSAWYEYRHITIMKRMRADKCKLHCEYQRGMNTIIILHGFVLQI